MFESYWSDLATGIRGVENAAFTRQHFPAIDVADFRKIVTDTNRFLDIVRGLVP
jgi:hypothetical protein